MIELKNIYKIYNENTENEVLAINGINIKFETCKLVCVVGESGCGKTTFINILAGIEGLSKGQYYINGLEASAFKEGEWDDYRNIEFGIVCQDYYLLDNQTVKSNLSLPQKINSQKELPSIKSVLSIVGLENYENRKVIQLSGGQKQRVAVARALVKNPSIVLADEPTGNLDYENSRSLFSLFKRISQDRLVVVVTHDINIANEFADRYIILKDGKVESDIENNNRKIDNFKLSILCNNEEKTYNGQGYKQFLNIIDKKILNSSDVNNIKFVSEINLYDRSKNIMAKPITVKNNEEIKQLSSKMKLKDLIMNSVSDMSHNSKRVIVTLLMLCLLTSLLLTVVFLKTNNNNRIIDNYLNKYDVSEASLYQSESYTDKFFDVHAKNLYINNSYYSMFENQSEVTSITYNLGLFSLADNIYSMGQNGINNVNDIDSVNIYKLGEDSNFDMQYSGALPKVSNDILITDYIADCLHLNQLKDNYIYINNIAFHVTGYISTDYVAYNIKNKIGTEDYTDISEYKLNQQYLVAYVSETALSNLGYYNNIISLNCSNFLVGDKFSLYNNSIVKYGYASDENLHNIQLEWGRYPEADDEILVSSSLLNASGITDYSKLSDRYYFNNIYDSSYNSYYDDYLNLYDYFQNGVKIVGVYNSLNLNSHADNSAVLVNPSIMKNIIDNYYEFYAYKSIRLEFNNTDNFVKFINNNDLRIDEPNIDKMYRFFSTINEYMNFIILGTIILSLVVVLLLINSLTNTILDNNRSIGIMRLIGVKKKDTLFIYMFQGAILIIFGLLTGLILSSMLIYYINKVFNYGIYENKFDILIVNYFSLAIVMISIITAGFIVTYLPIQKLSKLKPNEIIKL